MTGKLPTDWTELSCAAFRWPLELTRGFHDAGFFDHKLSAQYLDVTIHPIYFGKGHEYSYCGLNACKLKLSTFPDISELSLHQAYEAFSIMELKKTDSDLVFSFSNYVLKVALKADESRFKFLAIADGQDYWSRRY